MANNPIGSNFLEDGLPDRISDQDRRVANMTLDELREWRSDATKLATSGGRHASTHNRYTNQVVREIEEGVRLTNSDLQKLIKKARSKAGISAGELIEFTLGDTARNNELLKSLDAAILNTYLANIKRASQAFTGGITPQQIINLSRAVDIKRANQQIFLASLFKRKGNVFYFITNAGPDSKDKNHFVTVQLLDYPQLLVNTTKAPSPQVVRQILKDGKIKFDCDCGRHRYWYRYIATVGKYNFNIDENRYPSTRNPNLHGLGCKHVLRVMNHLTSGAMIEKVRAIAKQDIAKALNQTKSHVRPSTQVEREAQRQAQAMNNWNGRLHWSRKVKKIVDKAEKAIEQEVKKDRQKNPNRPSANEKRAYNFFKNSLKNGDFLDDETKSLFASKIKEYEDKWGRG
ncbi:MAG: hypothetical protein Q4P13_11255 [Psychrobacter sp.]|nr:hypothetical protein [Psychrobacter sp.]